MKLSVRRFCLMANKEGVCVSALVIEVKLFLEIFLTSGIEYKSKVL